MSKKSQAEPKKPKAPPEKLARPFADALRGVAIEKKAAAPPPKTFSTLFEEKKTAPLAKTPERTPPPKGAARAVERASTPDVPDDEALHDAFTGVTPLTRDHRSRVPNLPPGTSSLRRGAMPSYLDADADVRKRLGALVGGGVSFRFGKRDEDFIYGVRDDAQLDAWEPLARESVIADEDLDLHGLRAADAETTTVKFIRSRFRRGARVVRIVHGKGLHSESGTSVLRDAVITAITELGAAPLVYAFATASPKHGGSGAMFVLLKAKF